MIKKTVVKLLASLMISTHFLGTFPPLAEATSITPDTKAAQIRKFAPMVYLHKNEKYYPDDVNGWFSGTAMRYPTKDTRTYLFG